MPLKWPSRRLGQKLINIKGALVYYWMLYIFVDRNIHPVLLKPKNIHENIYWVRHWSFAAWKDSWTRTWWREVENFVEPTDLIWSVDHIPVTFWSDDDDYQTFLSKLNFYHFFAFFYFFRLKLFLSPGIVARLTTWNIESDQKPETSKVVKT